MEVKHTPGPWRAFETRVCFANMAGGFDIRNCPDAEANARLIAAAPELLEALKEVTSDYAGRFDLDDPSTNPGIKSSIKQAHAAIAKAEGLNIETGDQQ